MSIKKNRQIYFEWKGKKSDYLLQFQLFSQFIHNFSVLLILFNTDDFYSDFCYIVYSRGESAVLGRRMTWANRLFSKSMKGNILNFLHEVEKMISVISVQVLSEKLDFPFLKK